MKMKLEDFTLVERFFKDVGITPNWLYALSNGETFIYDDCILNYYIADGVLVVNSGSIGDAMFNKSILAHIKKIIETYSCVIISSSVESISEHMVARYGFTYDKKTLTYKKGV